MKIVTVNDIAEVIYEEAIRGVALYPGTWPSWRELQDSPAKTRSVNTAKEILRLLQKRLGDLKFKIEDFRD